MRLVTHIVTKGFFRGQGWARKSGAVLLEKEVEKRLRVGVEKLGGLCWKFVSPGQVGVPDRVVILPKRGECEARVVWVELKKSRADGGRLAPIQIWQHKRLHQMGAEVRTLWGVEDVEKFLEEERGNGLSST